MLPRCPSPMLRLRRCWRYHAVNHRLRWRSMELTITCQFQIQQPCHLAIQRTPWRLGLSQTSMGTMELLAGDHGALGTRSTP